MLEIDELARASGAILAARGSESLSNAVITEGALIDGILFGVEIAAAVGAGLDAVAAAETVLFVDEHDAIGADEGGAHGADLHAGRIDAVVAELGDEEALEVHGGGEGEPVHAAFGGIDFGLLVLFELVAFDPGAVVAIGDLVLIGAGADAVAAADALPDIDEHAPPMIGELIVIGGGFGAGDLLEGGAHGGEDEEFGPEVEEIAAGKG